MNCFGVVHLVAAFTVVYDEDEAAFVAKARDRASAQALKFPVKTHAHFVADGPAQQHPLRRYGELR